MHKNRYMLHTYIIGTHTYTCISCMIIHSDVYYTHTCIIHTKLFKQDRGSLTESSLWGLRK